MYAFHVTTRGNARQRIYRDDVDYLTFLRMLGDVVVQQEWTLDSYCLMPNHYHLLVVSEVPDLSRGMHLLNGRYARRFNARHGRSGHLFEGPYSAEPVTGDAHLMEACRYIAMNPVRAGLCRRPEDWPWSSYPAHAGLCDREDFLSPLPLPFESPAGYVAFVTAELDDCNLVETRLQAT